MTARTREEVLKHLADVEAFGDDGVCCCGGPIDHSPWEGHTPVSMYHYAIEGLREELRLIDAMGDDQEGFEVL